MNVQNEDNGVNRDYPVKTLRVFGGLQICIGVLCAILSIVVLIIDSVALSKNCYIENNGNYFFDKECEHNSLTAQSVFLFDILFCLSSGWVRTTYIHLFKSLILLSLYLMYPIFFYKIELK